MHTTFAHIPCIVPRKTLASCDMSDTAEGTKTEESGTALSIAYAAFKNARMRRTRQRTAILQYLIERDEPASIEAISAGMRAKACDMVTVYRCLNAFEEIGLVRATFAKNGTKLWEQSFFGPENYYVTCSRTNQMVRIDAERSSELSRALENVKTALAAGGYRRLTHSLQIFGETVPRLKRT